MHPTQVFFYLVRLFWAHFSKKAFVFKTFAFWKGELDLWAPFSLRLLRPERELHYRQDRGGEGGGGGTGKNEKDDEGGGRITALASGSGNEVSSGLQKILFADVRDATFL